MQEQILYFLSNYIYLYIWNIFTTFLNIMANISGSTVINPVTAFFTDPVRAIGIGAFIFFLTSVHRVLMFKENILREKKNIDIIKNMLPFSILGAFIGGLFLSYVNMAFLVILVVFVSVVYIFKNVKSLIKKDEEYIVSYKKDTSYLVGIFSGFIQGAGLPGADIRNNYIRQYVKETSVRAVSSFIGLFNFFYCGVCSFIS